MYTVLIVVHVIASIFLIAVILLQAGRGGGLADTMGGTQMQSLFGTKTKNVMAKLTTISAVLFIVTCLTLAIVSSQRSKSVIEKVNLPERVAPIETEEVTVESVSGVEGAELPETANGIN
ncbi:MAG: preprotein translocase subunit SecG [Candidatus Omnitrophota bacterium]|jgi:preprotein translocase subunit SecG|nr:preprotein translocase subunit SecG [Candidatus Omnitrophota bacterium]